MKKYMYVALLAGTLQCQSAQEVVMSTWSHNPGETLTVNNTTDTLFNLYYTVKGPNDIGYGEVQYGGFVQPNKQGPHYPRYRKAGDCVVKVNIEGESGTFANKAAFLKTKTDCRNINVTIKDVNGTLVITE